MRWDPIRSHAPSDLYAIWIKGPSPPCSRVDNHLFHYGLQNGTLPLDVETTPDSFEILMSPRQSRQGVNVACRL